MTNADIIGLLIAALGGAAVGLERQWSGHAEGPDARFAGIRTFTMLGAVGGFSGWLWTIGITAPAAMLFAGGIGLVAIGYFRGSRQDIDGTTEVAALVVLAAGVIAGIGSTRLASGSIALTTFLLVEKSRLHSLVKRIDDTGLRSGARFAVMALVILPLLPEGRYGPLGGIRPRGDLGACPVLFRAQFCRLPGPPAGRPGPRISGDRAARWTGFFDEYDIHVRAREQEGPGDGSGACVRGRSGERDVVSTGAGGNGHSERGVLPPLARYLAGPAIVAALVAAAGLRRVRWDAGATEVELRNPLQLRAALQMAVLFQAVLMAVYLAREMWGRSGVLTSAAMLGLTDVNALTVSMAREVAQTVSPEVAATAIAVGVLANTAMKLVLALVFGSTRFRTIAGGALAMMLLAGGGAMLVLQ